MLLVGLAVPWPAVDLRLREALPRADVDLAKGGLVLDRQPEVCADDPGCLRGAAEVARVDGVEQLSREPLRQLCRLGPTSLVQRRIRMPLVSPLAVPLSLAVARDEEGRHELYASRPWTSGFAIGSASSPARRAGSAARSRGCSPRRARGWSRAAGGKRPVSARRSMSSVI